ncbi:uncharacterized protein METZ01_LOCUS143004 [marine metagenome]|uniref:Uncharacterized protein n=1 Tax=marine metagenome TaxID=408172 RepID=A0A381ZLL9_9ZZZZ
MSMIKNKMSTAYRVAQEMIKDKLKDVDEDMAAEFEELGQSEVIVSKGVHDYIEQVFNGIGLKHNLINPQQFEKIDLDPDKIIFINCPGNVTSKGLRNLVTFVEKGGFLFTTDWALRHVIEPGFPGYIKYNNRPTNDEVVRVDILAEEDPFLQSLIGPNDDPQWWLEGSSYPIEILNHKEVDILIKSKEIEKKYGESAVFVTFDYGKGKIYHMISHFYLQRAETRTARHAKSGAEYAYEKLNMDEYREEKYKNMGIDDANLSDVEAAYSSSSMMNKILWDKRKMAEMEREDEKD